MGKLETTLEAVRNTGSFVTAIEYTLEPNTQGKAYKTMFRLKSDCPRGSVTIPIRVTRQLVDAAGNAQRHTVMRMVASPFGDLPREVTVPLEETLVDTRLTLLRESFRVVPGKDDLTPDRVRIDRPVVFVDLPPRVAAMIAHVYGEYLEVRFLTKDVKQYGVTGRNEYRLSAVTEIESAWSEGEAPDTRAKEITGLSKARVLPDSGRRDPSTRLGPDKIKMQDLGVLDLAKETYSAPPLDGGFEDERGDEY